MNYSDFIGNADYNRYILSRGVISYDYYMSGKMTDIHNQLFNRAISAYISAHPELGNINEYRVVDNKREIFFEPSIAYLIPKKRKDGTFKVTTIDFSQPDVEGWDNSYIIKTIFLDPSLKFIKNDGSIMIQKEDGTIDVKYAETYEEYKESLENIINSVILDSEITEWDFVRGRAKLSSRNKVASFWVDYKYINGGVILADSMKLDDTFMGILKK